MDPFTSLRGALGDPTNMLLCICVFLSYIPDAGQTSCIFLYLTEVINFTKEKVTSFIAVCGVLSILAQTVLLTTLMQTTSKLTTIMVGLIFQTIQLFCYAFGHTEIIMWTAGAFYAISTITYPAISSLVSTNAELDQQVIYNSSFSRKVKLRSLALPSHMKALTLVYFGLEHITYMMQNHISLVKFTRRIKSMKRKNFGFCGA